jgi:rRNA processing protein Gar1
VKRGDLVKSSKFDSIGVVVEVFGDLDKSNPWIRVLFTHPTETYQWIKAAGLEIIEKRKEGDDPPFRGENGSGSL